MFKVSRSVARPVAMFVDRSNAATIDTAIDAGVSAYIVGGLRKDRVKPILDTTMNRFKAFAKLKKGLPGGRRSGWGPELACCQPAGVATSG